MEHHNDELLMDHYSFVKGSENISNETLRLLHPNHKDARIFLADFCDSFVISFIAFPNKVFEFHQR